MRILYTKCIFIGIVVYILYIIYALYTIHFVYNIHIVYYIQYVFNTKYIQLINKLSTKEVLRVDSTLLR